jgi:hypothetical protein
MIEENLVNGTYLVSFIKVVRPSANGKWCPWSDGVLGSIPSMELFSSWCLHLTYHTKKLQTAFVTSWHLIHSRIWSGKDSRDMHLIFSSQGFSQSLGRHETSPEWQWMETLIDHDDTCGKYSMILAKNISSNDSHLYRFIFFFLILAFNDNIKFLDLWMRWIGL